MGLSAQKRALHIQFSNPNLAAQFLATTMDTYPSDGLNYNLICLSTRNNIALKSFIGLCLRLIDDNTQYKSLERRIIRFHRSSAVEQQDTITALTGLRSLQPTSVHIQRWQADMLDIEEGAGNVLSKYQQSENYDNASLGLEQVWQFSPAWTQDLNGEDGVTPSAKQFIAISTVRDAQVGYYFELNQHPNLDLKDVADRQFLIISKTFYHQNNLPKDLSHKFEMLLKQSQWQLTHITANNSEQRQANQLLLQRRNIAVVPEYNPLKHRPTTYPMRARVNFLFTRHEDHQHDGGAGANDNDTDSAWVDVLTPWAGEGYGVRFLPRVGEIVMISFSDGDIDRPFVVGRIHEGYRYPTKFDDQGKLPDTKKLSGIKTKEYKSDGFNQLRFDDTTNQISTQLHSSHATSQLNLGNLSHPKETETSEGRGEGFELRTDQWGNQAKGDHLDATPAKKQLEGSQNKSKALNDIAKNQKTDEIESVEQLKIFAQQLQQEIAKFNQAVLLLSSQDGNCFKHT
ncbi:hypothetical protein FQR65_LT18189 [Abscondita terminalis]|nr:hypothetical protein FQR65_LT18189 [Abscondita terminalis]